MSQQSVSFLGLSEVGPATGYSPFPCQPAQKTHFAAVMRYRELSRAGLFNRARSFDKHDRWAELGDATLDFIENGIGGIGPMTCSEQDQRSVAAFELEHAIRAFSRSLAVLDTVRRCAYGWTRQLEVQTD